MTAFVVHPEHINVLLWAGLKDPRLGALRWDHPNTNPTNSTELQPETASETGQMLLDINIAAVSHLYNEPAEPQHYTYRPPRHRHWTNVELLKALHCYQYQADEHPDWHNTQARAFCRALEKRLIYRLPGYNEGPWAIEPTTRPAADRASA